MYFYAIDFCVSINYALHVLNHCNWALYKFPIIIIIIIIIFFFLCVCVCVCVCVCMNSLCDSALSK